MALTIMIEEGWFALLGYQLKGLLSPLISCIPGLSKPGSEDQQEDDDVAKERYRIPDGELMISPGFPCFLAGGERGSQSQIGQIMP